MKIKYETPLSKTWTASLKTVLCGSQLETSGNSIDSLQEEESWNIFSNQ